MKHDDEACVKPDGPLSCFRVGDLCFTIWPQHGLVEVVEIDLEVESRGWAHIEALAIGDHPPAYQDGQTNQYYYKDLLPLELGGLVRNLTPLLFDFYDLRRSLRRIVARPFCRIAGCEVGPTLRCKRCGHGWFNLGLEQHWPVKCAPEWLRRYVRSLWWSVAYLVFGMRSFWDL